MLLESGRNNPLPYRAVEGFDFQVDHVDQVVDPRHRLELLVVGGHLN